MILEENMSHLEQVQVNRMVVPAGRYSSRSGTVGCLKRYGNHRGKEDTICSTKTLFSSRTLNEPYAARFPCRLADWSSGSVVKAR